MSEHNNQRYTMSSQEAERQITALQQTVQRLEGELAAAHDRLIKLTHYVEIAREFGEIPPRGSGEPRESARERPNGAGSGSKAPKGGMSGRAVRECIAILRDRREFIPTQQLYDLIQQRGIQLGGRSPVSALSGYLSRTPGVVADKEGRRGWGLGEWNS